MRWRRLMGFGRRVWNYDPRAKIIRERDRRCPGSVDVDDPRYLILRAGSRKLRFLATFHLAQAVSNVDFFPADPTADGFPPSRCSQFVCSWTLACWIAQWREMINDPATEEWSASARCIGAVRPQHYVRSDPAGPALVVSDQIIDRFRSTRSKIPQSSAATPTVMPPQRRPAQAPTTDVRRRQHCSRGALEALDKARGC